MASCGYIREGSAFQGARSNVLCPGTGVSVALPGPAYYDNGSPPKYLPAVAIANASLVVNVSAITNCAGDFKIGLCDGNTNGVTNKYNASTATELPLIVIVPHQCAKIEHSFSERAGNSSCVGDPTITVDIALIGDYCAVQPTSKYCAAGTYNTKATAAPSSHAPPSIKQRLLVALSTIACVVVTVA